MALDDPLAITGLPVSALEWRRAQAAQFVHSDDALSATPGVLYGYGCSVVTLTVTVAAGSAVISPSTGANGSYVAVNNAAATVTATAQDATYARIDRVVVRIYDNEVDAGGQNKAAVEIITGTPAAVPAAPALPAGRLEIAQLQVPKSGSGSITVVDKRIYTAATGGVLVVPSYAALPTGSWLRVGQKAYTADYGVPWRWNGTVWVVDGVPQLASTGARDAAIPSPTAGTRVVIGSGATMVEQLYNGAAWVESTAGWVDYTPTVAGITIGNGTVVGRYSKVGTTVIAEVLVTLGSTSAVTGAITVTLPVTAARSKLIGSATARPTGSGSNYQLTAFAAAASTLVAVGVPGTNGILANVSATSPATWAATGWLLVQITYEAA